MFFSAESKFVVEIGKKTRVFFYIFFNAKIAKKLFFMVRKKPKGYDGILILDSDSATQNTYNVTTLVHRTTYFFRGAVM